MSATGLTGQQSLAERGALASGDDAASSSRTRRAFSRWVPAAFLQSSSSDKSHYRDLRTVALLSLIAPLLRIAFLLQLFRHWPLSEFWHSGLESNFIAASIAQGHGFASPYGGATGATAWMPPVYPLIAAAAFKVFGVFSIGALWALLMFNTACSVATVVVIYLLGRHCFSRNVGLYAAVVWAISLDSLSFVARTWESSLSALLLACAVYWHLRMLQSPARARTWILYGMLWGFIALTNTAFILFLPLSLLQLATTGHRLKWRGPAVALLTCLALVTPWTIRNYVAFHRLIPIRGNFGPNLWYGNHPGVTGPADESLIPADNAAELRDYANLGDAAYAASRNRLAVEYIRNNPREFARLTWARIVFYWTAPRVSGRWLPTAFSAFGFLGLAAMFFGGLRRYTLPFAYALLLYPVPYYITHTENIYRYPIEPLLTLLSIYLCSVAITAWKSRSAMHHAYVEGAGVSA